ncbi:S8 family serine peptidase [Rickettsiales endosymbiont of Peranema trichophorum]|uniref:S8 family serine peptidase n=1 Tax=Rickettsiales endosymbiont of Peranema trichophorum TaxID=2486577 RepID=UPI0013EED0FD|nr:S8 family serine peptidase [Rickettsiales endosymbiont of Peranema trichophorum]
MSMEQCSTISPWYVEDYIVGPLALYDSVLDGGNFVHSFIADSCIYRSKQINIGTTDERFNIISRESVVSQCTEYFKEYHASSSLDFISTQIVLESKISELAKGLRTLQEDYNITVASLDGEEIDEDMADELKNLVNQVNDTEIKKAYLESELNKLNKEKVIFYHGTCIASLIGGQKQFLAGHLADSTSKSCVAPKAGGLTGNTVVIPFNAMIYDITQDNYPDILIKDIYSVLRGRKEGGCETDGVGNCLFFDDKETDVFVLNLSLNFLNSQVKWGSFYNKLSIEQKLYDRVLLIIAAGNEGMDLDSVDAYPAKLPQRLNITDVEVKYKLTVASARDGKSLCSNSNYNSEYVDIAAPGQGIICLAPFEYINYDTTKGSSSNAATFVTSLVSMLLSCDPVNMNNSTRIVNAIEDFARIESGLSTTKVKGGKMLDYQNVLREVCNFEPKNKRL